MVTNYIAYLKNNPHGYWFKKKLYGWGWVPARWQGWVVTFVYIAAVATLTRTIAPNSGHERHLVFLGRVALLTGVLIAICYRTGEPPRWQWGTKDTSKS
jgi:hypothetical protein